MWGIGRSVEKNLNSMGIFSVGSLANYPLKLLEKKFGVMGTRYIIMPGELIILK